MKRIVSLLLSVVAAFLVVATLARANNTFPGTTITGINTNFTASTVGATGETGEPVPPFPAGNPLNTMWYSWTAPGNGTVTFETCGTAAQTNFDTVIASYTGTAVNALTLITQNDDTTGCAAAGNANYGSRITWDVTAGNVYRVQLDGYNGATGTAARVAYRFTGFTITKSASVATIAAPGTITYTINVANTGYIALTGTSITDALVLDAASRTLTSGPTLISGDAAPLGTLGTTETWVYQATFAVPQADIDLGGTYANRATFDTAQTVAYTSNAATTAITQSPALSIDKTYVITTDGGTPGVADVGDVITYTYAVSNSGNITINGVSVSDVHQGEGSLSAITPASVATLAPGASTNFTATYTTVQLDIDNQ